MINRINEQEMLMQIAQLAMNGMRYEINNHHTKDISTEVCRTMTTIHEVAMTLYKMLEEEEVTG